MRESKKSKLCPGFYKIKAPSEEQRGANKKTFMNEVKGCAFIDEQKRLSALTPGAKYTL